MNRDVREVQIDQVICRPQARDPQSEALSERGIAEIAASIAQHGVLMPLLVRQKDGTLVCVDGERRLRGAKKAGLKTVPVLLVPDSLTPAELLIWQCIANCQRRGLSPIEMGKNIQRLEEMRLPRRDIALKLGTSEAQVSKVVALLTLPESVQRQVESGLIPISTAYEIAGAGNRQAQEALAAEVVAKGLTRDAVCARNRARKHPAKTAASAKPTRVPLVLPGGMTITVAGVGLSLDVIANCLAEALARVRKAIPKGLGLDTLVKLLKDEAKAGDLS